MNALRFALGIFSRKFILYFNIAKPGRLRSAGFCLFTGRAITGKCKKLSLSGELASRSDD